MTTNRGCCLVHESDSGPAGPRRQSRDMPDYKEILRRLALGDEAFVASALGMDCDTADVSQLDQKTYALARVSASLALDGAPSSYQSNVELALAAGASVDEVVGCLIAVVPTIGLARAVSAAPELALALGYDVDEALEAPDGAAS